MKSIKLIELILGIWVLVSPWLVADVLRASNIITGLLLVLAACLNLFGSKAKPQI